MDCKKIVNSLLKPGLDRCGTRGGGGRAPQTSGCPHSFAFFANEWALGYDHIAGADELLAPAHLLRHSELFEAHSASD